MDFEFPSVMRSSRGEEADRYEAFGLLRVTLTVGSEGCLGVEPFPFDLNDEGPSLESKVADGMVFVVMSV